MDDETMEMIKTICESMESNINKKMQSVVNQYDTLVAMNILVNVGTSILAKALILAQDDHLKLRKVLIDVIDGKVEEGRAAVNSLVAISKAMGEPPAWPPKH